MAEIVSSQTFARTRALRVSRGRFGPVSPQPLSDSGSPTFLSIGDIASHIGHVHDVALSSILEIESKHGRRLGELGFAYKFQLEVGGGYISGSLTGYSTPHPTEGASREIDQQHVRRPETVFPGLLDDLMFEIERDVPVTLQPRRQLRPRI